jgi:hypothetical protein
MRWAPRTTASTMRLRAAGKRRVTVAMFSVATTRPVSSKTGAAAPEPPGANSSSTTA